MASLASVLAVLWMAASAVSMAEDAGPTPVHAPDNLSEGETWTPVTATPAQPPCSANTQEKLARFSLFNMALQRRCQDQSGGVNAFPFDVAPSREQLVRLSASPACLMVCKGLLRVIEYECILGDFKMPVRATAETILKLNQDRKDLVTYPVPTEAVLQEQIVERARMNHARDVDPINFSVDHNPVEMQQYESQLTKAYATGGIVLLSADLQITSDLSATEQVGSEAATAAVAQLVDTQSEAAVAPMSQTGSLSNADSSADQGHELESSAPPTNSHGSFKQPANSASGSLTDSTVTKLPVSLTAAPIPLSSSIFAALISGALLTSIYS